MNTDKLFSILSAIHPLPESFKRDLKKELRPLSLPAHHLLLEAPRISEYAYFLDEGFAMSFTFVDARKRVESFWKSGQVIFLAKSFFEEIPATENIQLMAKSDLLCISHNSVLKLFNDHEEANFIYRVIMNQYYEQSQERIHDWQELSSSQRHQKLLTQFPDIEQIVPQDLIASYLGITPQSLSRIKRRESTS